MRLSFDTLFWSVDAAVYYVQAWVLTPRRRLLLERLPAIVLAVGMLSLFTNQFSGPDPDLVSFYTSQSRTRLLGATFRSPGHWLGLIMSGPRPTATPTVRARAAQKPGVTMTLWSTPNPTEPGWLTGSLLRRVETETGSSQPALPAFFMRACFCDQIAAIRPTLPTIPLALLIVPAEPMSCSSVRPFASHDLEIISPRC